ncbi:MAG: hypothetical protein QOJ39_3389 [Candidatus Eremiobacteraeota bacterium]|jgi:hypothetical protein|nr:hypothetical protein [Candidatus Eremiobacteraeota bacterium]MEA2721525.1 hypothetical protein [Candidatus Eremiobacteraeota bacterium]
MPAGLILRFPGKSRTDYDAVNAKLDIDMTEGTNFPDGLLSHAAGEDGGALYVIEVWESRDAQGRFMQERLGRALQEGGVTGAPEITWIDPLVSYHTPGRTAGI